MDDNKDNPTGASGVVTLEEPTVGDLANSATRNEEPKYANYKSEWFRRHGATPVGTTLPTESFPVARNAQEYREEEARLGGIDPYPTSPPTPVIPPISPTMEQVKANWASLPEVEKAKYQAEAAVAAADLARKQALTLEQQRNKGFFGWLRSLFSRKSEPVTEKKVESHSDQAPAPQQPVPEPTVI